MYEKKKKAVVPRLRFPEFRDAGEWEVKKIGDIFRITRGNVLSMMAVSESPSLEYPYPVYSSQTKNDGLSGYYSDYLHEDSITWTTDGANAGDVKYREGRFYCTNVCGVLISEDGHANSFVAELLNTVTKKHVSYVGNPKLMNGVMAQIQIPFPKIEEQRKIADCLASLDDLIRAGEAQLVALKDHKKGLMQQLFPREGETTPRLRFPEFRDAGEWGMQRLGEVIAVEKSDLSMSDVGLPDFSPFPVYGANGIVGSRDSFQQENTCISMVKDGSGVGRLMLVSAPASVLSTLMWLKPKGLGRVSTSFLFYAISSLNLTRYVIGSGIPHLYFTDISAAKITLPRLQEQQKIADCLTSLDDLIRAGEAQLVALKDHKKGLMQQLFPQEVG